VFRGRRRGLRRSSLAVAADDGIEFVDTQFIRGEVSVGFGSVISRLPQFEDPDCIAN
jgi:hypothetical protein